MYFILTDHTLPDLVEGERANFTFELLPNITQRITSILKSCHCFDVSIDSFGKSVTISFKAPKIPPHLIFQGYAYTDKYLTVTFDDNSQETLTLSAKIVKRR